MWKYIKDPIHGYIKINKEDEEIIDTPSFQRLRNIFQMGTSFLTYPGAVHSRFEHSLGVMSLGVTALENVINNSISSGLDYWSEKGIRKRELEKMRRTLRYACLLHDVGHAPFSHVCEIFFEEEVPEIVDELIEKYKIKFIPKQTDATCTEHTRTVLGGKPPHELLSCYIVLSKYKKPLEDVNVNPLDVCSIILGQERYGIPKKYENHYNVLSNILSSSIDVDKLDYLLRDNYMTGASLISLDKDRALSSYTISKNNRLVLSGKGLSLISNLMNGRQQIYMWVYQHHKVIYTNTLLRKMVENLVVPPPNSKNSKKSLVKKEELFSKEALSEKLIDDYDVIRKIRENTSNDQDISELYSVWCSRRNFLKSCWKHVFEFREKIENDQIRKDLLGDAKGVWTANKMEKLISKKLHIKQTDVFVSSARWVPFSPSGSLDIPVEINGVIKSAISDLGLYTPNIENYSKVPYIFVKKNYKDKCIKYLKNYDSSKLRDIT